MIIFDHKNSSPIGLLKDQAKPLFLPFTIRHEIHLLVHEVHHESDQSVQFLEGGRLNASLVIGYN